MSPVSLMGGGLGLSSLRIFPFSCYLLFVNSTYLKNIFLQFRKPPCFSFRCKYINISVFINTKCLIMPLKKYIEIEIYHVFASL